MGAAETERAGGGRGRGAARVGRASKPAGRGKRQLPEKRHGSHAAFQLPPSPPGREREIEYRERERESPLFTFQLLPGEAAG